ncbi:hypothetical protein ACUOA8_37940, partial [Escherichia sp. SS-MK2]
MKQAIPARLPQATRSALISQVRQLITPRLFAITVITDEAMFAPPQGITIEAVNGMLAERLA